MAMAGRVRLKSKRAAFSISAASAGRGDAAAAAATAVINREFLVMDLGIWGRSVDLGMGLGRLVVPLEKILEVVEDAMSVLALAMAVVP